MATFDQRKQKVNTQYNIAGNVNFSNVDNGIEFVRELQKLRDEIKNIAISKLDSEVAKGLEAKINQVASQAESSKPDKKSMLENIQEAQKLLGSVASAAGLIKILAEAAEVIRRLF